MTVRLESLTRPRSDTDFRIRSKHRTVGLVIGFGGLVLVLVTLIANFVLANRLESDATGAASLKAWSFGLTTFGFGTLKFGIAVILVGILVRLWLRVAAIRESLPSLNKAGSRHVEAGRIDTAFGKANTTSSVPAPLPIHRMATTMWAPMLAMGAMALTAGMVISLGWASNASNPALARDLGAWTQGLMFLGEGFLLAGISMILGSILAALREGGGSVQEAVGVEVKTLSMPTTAKAFVGLMMLGLMLSVAQFVLYLVSIGVEDPVSFAAWSAWLGPLRELGLGLLLAGIVLALVTIANVLGFQFARIREIVSTGN